MIMNLTLFVSRQVATGGVNCCININKNDVLNQQQLTARLLNEWNSSLIIKEDFFHEICRSGGAEVPSVAAFIGGCAAQEVIKIITSQYIPLNNTLIYNAINSTTTSFVI